MASVNSSIILASSDADLVNDTKYRLCNRRIPNLPTNVDLMKIKKTIGSSNFHKTSEIKINSMFITKINLHKKNFQYVQPKGNSHINY